MPNRVLSIEMSIPRGALQIVYATMYSVCYIGMFSLLNIVLPTEEKHVRLVIRSLLRFYRIGKHLSSVDIPHPQNTTSNIYKTRNGSEIHWSRVHKRENAESNTKYCHAAVNKMRALNFSFSLVANWFFHKEFN